MKPSNERGENNYSCNCRSNRKIFRFCNRLLSKFGNIYAKRLLGRKFSNTPPAMLSNNENDVKLFSCWIDVRKNAVLLSLFVFNLACRILLQKVLQTAVVIYRDNFNRTRLFMMESSPGSFPVLSTASASSFYTYQLWSHLLFETRKCAVRVCAYLTTHYSICLRLKFL